MKKIICLLTLAGCIQVNTEIKAAEINGTIKDGAGKKIYLEKFEMNRPVKIDSAIITKKNKFKFITKDTLTDFYRLSFNNSDFIVLIISKTEKINLTADANNLNKTYTVTGSPHSEKLLTFVNSVNDYVKIKDSISTLAVKNNNQDQELSVQLNKDLTNKYAEFIAFRNKFLDENPSSPALVAVTNHLNLQNDAKNELVHLKKIESALQQSMPGSYYYTSIHDIVTQIEQQIVAEEKQKEINEKKARMYDAGNELPDIALNGVDGKELKLSSLRGQYVLVDFWASWCGPCRKENPNVVKLYNKYKEKGFTVYSVSLDNSKERWIDAIEKDNLTWENHVSELKGWQTSILPEFSVSSIPFTVLLDKEGKVVQANLRGPALENKLSEIFGF